MTKPLIIHLAKLLFIFFPFVNIAQSYLVPKTTQFAGITINISKDAQTIIQNDIKNLLNNKTYLNAKLDRVLLYFPIVEKILAAEGVPDDFKYLCVQESGLLPDAVSKSNAVGFWQFKRETALDFGLRIDEQIDERKNIHASTRVACLYLKRNFQVLNNWISALNSYRTGLGNVYKFIPKEWYGSQNISVTAKTDFYVLRAIAHKMVFEKEIANYKPSNISFFEYTFNTGKSVVFIAKELNVSEDDIWKYNRWINIQSAPEDKPYTLKEGMKIIDLTLSKASREVSIPIVKGEVATQNTEIEEFKLNSTVQIHQVNNYTHTVKNGENFYSIARRYNVSVTDVWTWNKMNKDVKLGVGKKLFIKFGHYYDPPARILAQDIK